MNIEDYRNYCLSKKGVTESFPFDEDTLVFKVLGKMFALVSLSEGNINLKCDPERAVQLRETFAAVRPGYHMNKTHWNSILPDPCLSDRQLMEWTDHSYEVVLNSLPRKKREELL